MTVWKCPERLSLAEKLDWYSIPDPASGCIICWRGTDSHGYPHIRKGTVLIRASRLAYQLNIGAIPAGAYVLHRCDFRACVNPDHLFLGTNADNVADRQAKGRTARGSRSGLAKLTEEMIPAIRVDGRPCSQIAKIYAVDAGTIRAVKNGKTWRHVP